MENWSNALIMFAQETHAHINWECKVYTPVWTQVREWARIIKQIRMHSNESEWKREQEYLAKRERETERSGQKMKIGFDSQWRYLSIGVECQSHKLLALPSLFYKSSVVDVVGAGAVAVAVICSRLPFTHIIYTGTIPSHEHQPFNSFGYRSLDQRKT